MRVCVLALNATMEKEEGKNNKQFTQIHTNVSKIIYLSLYSYEEITNLSMLLYMLNENEGENFDCIYIYIHREEETVYLFLFFQDFSFSSLFVYYFFHVSNNTRSS